MSKADVSNTPIRSRGALLAGKAVRSKSVKKKNLVRSIRPKPPTARSLRNELMPIPIWSHTFAIW
jgi:hypothetical protein